MKRPLIPLDEAVETVIRTALSLRDSREPPLRTVSIWEASGLVLAEDVVADRPMPPFDKSMMDGFAFSFDDLEGVPREERKVFDLVGEVAAGGRFPRALARGEAVAIMTGAPVPEGADTVQVVEVCEREDDTVIVPGGLSRGANVTRTGAQVRGGEVVVERGRVIESLTAGVLATVGKTHVQVYRRPRVTVIATGDELVNVDETPQLSQIRDSNRRTLMALAESEWCRVVDGGIVRDDRSALRQAIAEGLESDVLVLSGGVSAGEYDYVRECLELEGAEILFHQVAVKPGKPVLFGRSANALVFGLPGNPVSSFVTAALLLTPALRVLGRRPEHRTWELLVPVAEGEIPRTGKRTTFHPGVLVRGERPHALAVNPRPWDGSADHVAYARSNVLIRREVDSPAAGPGDFVRVLLPGSLVQW